MKTRNNFQRALIAVPVLLASLVFTSCDKDDDDVDDRTYTLSGSASGSQENPAVVTNGAATMTGTYNASTNRLNYTINWTGLSGAATNAHIHGPALAGVNAGALTDLSITTNGVAGTLSGDVTLADSVENYLLDGKLYYNIHTAANINGEIRGQITTTPN
jgi:hypothetical protein